MTPRATYRIQFHKGFTFSDLVAHATYFADLGISHIYSSPILTARAGSMHGYDVVDHSHINPELGGEVGFRALAEALRQHEIGLIVDIVPNHMAVGQADNPWWLDVLQCGPASRHARAFDIDWNAPGLEGKILAPFLGEAPETALSKGDLHLTRDARLGMLCFAYHEHRFPLRPADQGLSAISKPPFDDLIDLLSRQNFVLADWREADTRINWRRFFDITDLAAIRIAEPDIFEAVHAKTFALYGQGLIDGVRVDHVDGIADPRGYCRLLRQRLEALRPGAYIVVEKILAEKEELPPDWQVDGTTGYDFMNQVSALQHREDGGILTALWDREGKRGGEFEPEERQARAEMLRTKFVAQLDSTVRAFAKVLPRIPVRELREALSAVLVRLRCYRSYATGQPGSPGAGPFLNDALIAGRTEHPVHDAAFSAIAALFARTDGDALVVDALRRFSQLSAPVAAKSVEDTAFYRYGRVLSRNDVGFDPRRHEMSHADFHRFAEARASGHPRAMLATATHDNKRGEDARARLAALSVYGTDWWNLAGTLPRFSCVHSADAYQLCQALVGAWPRVPPDGDFLERIQGWCIKYLREAKLRSSWDRPDTAYEEAFRDYARLLIMDEQAGDWRGHLLSFLDKIEERARVNSLVQVVLRCSLPGIPDLYQGCEFWDLSLVDPDNRRPVDFGERVISLRRKDNIKQDLIARLLNGRRSDPALWENGNYRPMMEDEETILAFSRTHHSSQLIVLVRTTPDGILSGDLSLTRRFRNVLRDVTCGPGNIRLAELFGSLPAVVLHHEIQAR